MGPQDFVSVLVLRLGIKGLGIKTYQTIDYPQPLFPTLVWAVWLWMRSSFPPAGQMSLSSPDCVIYNPVHQSPGTSKYFSLLNKISSDADFQMQSYKNCILDSENQVKIIH